MKKDETKKTDVKLTVQNIKISTKAKVKPVPTTRPEEKDKVKKDD